MAQNNQYQPSFAAQSSSPRITKPNSEFYSHFSPSEILEIIHALETRREIPLKFAYKGRGAKIWDDFYLKYIRPTWYRTSSVEINLLKENFSYLNGDFQKSAKINVVDVGVGNSYPVKAYIRKLNQLDRINKYVALDISHDLLKISQRNLQKWFPHLEFVYQILDIENTSISPEFIHSSADIANIFLHLGVTIGNHQNPSQVFKNFYTSMKENDLLVITNEIGASRLWNGSVRGGCDYHAGNIYNWMQNSLKIHPQDCELIRKYDSLTDSVVANLKFLQNYNINFNFLEIDQNVEISAGEEVTIWRHRKLEISEIIAEIEANGFQLVHYSTNKYASHVMIICRIK